MTDVLDCGHTAAEHDEEKLRLENKLAKGDLTVLVPSLSNTALAALLQAASIEMLVRTESREYAENIWDAHDQLVRKTFFVAEAEDSLEPDWYRAVERERQVFLHQLETNSARTTADGLGPNLVADEEDDYFPGQYL